MSNAKEQQSEVRRLLQQIQEEYEAGRRGLNGLSYGTAHHEFITRRMENMGQMYDELRSLVGEVATSMVLDTFNAASEDRGHAK